MKKFNHKVTAAMMSAILMASTLVGCGQMADNTSASVAVQNEVYAAATTNGVETVSQKIPKYIFLFIGDGMSYPQIQSASYYLGAKASDGGDVTGGVDLSFMNFPTVGSARTFDSTSFCPDSASTATSIRMTVTIVVVTPIILVYPIFQRFFTKGIMIGAVKG